MANSFLTPRQIKAKHSFEIGKSLLTRGEEERAAPYIKDACFMGNREAHLYYGAQCIAKGDLSQGLACLMKYVGYDTPKGITYWPSKSNAVASLAQHADADSLYFNAMKHGIDGLNKNEGICFTLSTAALLNTVEHVQAPNAASYVMRLILRIKDFEGTKNGICAIMSDKTTAPLETIPAAIKAIGAFRRYEHLHGLVPLTTPLLNS